MREKVEKQKKRGGVRMALILAAAVCVVAAIAWGLLSDPAGEKPSKDHSNAGLHIELEDQRPINLGYGLAIVDAGRYTGLYMEDGSNEILSDIMMVVVRNDGERDLQFAEITAVCSEEEYQFTLTNLGAGKQAVLLAKDRKTAVGGQVTSATMENPVLFQDPMSLQEDAIQISGLEGMLNVKNISSSDITNDIYVYYKYSAEDIFYGGITFRICVEGGLKADEIRQIPAGHYTPDGCTIVQVTTHG